MNFHPIWIFRRNGPDNPSHFPPKHHRTKEKKNYDRHFLERNYSVCYLVFGSAIKMIEARYKGAINPINIWKMPKADGFMLGSFFFRKSQRLNCGSEEVVCFSNCIVMPGATALASAPSKAQYLTEINRQLPLNNNMPALKVAFNAFTVLNDNN